MPEAVFIDTWGWLALGHRRDARHLEVKAFYQRLQEEGARLYTTDYVLDEVITLLFRREPFEEAVRFTEGIFQASQEGRLTYGTDHLRTLRLGVGAAQAVSGQTKDLLH